MPVKNIQDALDKVDEKKIWGYIEFPETFSRNVYDRILGKSASNSTIRGSQIGVRLDMSSKLIDHNLWQNWFILQRLFR